MSLNYLDVRQWRIQGVGVGGNGLRPPPKFKNILLKIFFKQLLQQCNCITVQKAM